ncbi:Crp/Fnr family transcriptional regulator [Methylomonas paludis]|uniref:Crp/Fnr family transcriptional regulator n=1 Tax=Methylomonas paludis TaxID=1173101 RepID=A0A975MR02_9GAMM|nr:Crp/Fnr family transcriptional regulator [Methylomonas paludis]QWF72391.1 Crp/Fnr family transcriptional regulator [Methylomonas paludis]
MTSTRPNYAANQLLTALPFADREQLVSLCEPVQLEFGDIIYEHGDQVPHVYFPTGSFISLVTPLEGNAGLEVGLIGNEGMAGITLILGVEIAPFQALVQGAGPALRISAAAFTQEVANSPALYSMLKRYLYVTVSELAQTAACCRIHVVEARLARWLLMTQDRAHADTFHITHLFLAYMLGVRRVGITKAASSLQRRKLISYRRGHITVLNRAGLEAAACSCYQAEKKIYQLIMG